MKTIPASLILCLLVSLGACTQNGKVAQVLFDKNITSHAGASITTSAEGTITYTKGLNGKAVSISPEGLQYLTINSETIQFDSNKDFSVQFWMRTSMDSDKPTVLLSQKRMENNSLNSQKESGWALYTYGGTFAWNMGSGNRRIRYERDNGHNMPMNDGKWHLLTMTYDSDKSEIKLFYDGENKAWYSVRDGLGFDFESTMDLTVGWRGTDNESDSNILPEIEEGVQLLQNLVNDFNQLGVGDVGTEDFESLIVDPKGLFEQKVEELKLLTDKENRQILNVLKLLDIDTVMRSRASLMKNRYTVHQVRDFMTVAPLLKIYSLHNGIVALDMEKAKNYSKMEKFYPPDFDMDNLMIWDRVVSAEEVLSSYSDFQEIEAPVSRQKLSSIVATDWNIHHGGIHNTIEEDGFDSRLRIVEMLKKENADVIMMQETYSNGDFIAAELGYYFATTVDWDYLNQGSNISVLSRFPIMELHVPPEAPFMNVAVKVSISDSQEMYVMSNWYGMNQFPAVYEFHESRFLDSDNIPVIFAGDFNAVPHTDGGNSPASIAMLKAGFTDAYRELFPDVEQFPGNTFQNGRRIDQLYYKGSSLKNVSTKVVSSWPNGFPSDHFMITTVFELR
ncbi:MAG: hypothetical protein HN352_03785 [Bacteroidetes bacterium]|jgi:exonuclease III|nr:hypothetical protein [Bacteroidota bacterium]MBT4399098.1 hypothetical protein [Bacteroidota bacterium]MBT4408401.1 hypothetical protein [Bacteroidota bacterium]MBT5427500.1 hypothetical protein [Bacteroidota bacterium]MBT7093580.1 hypothetical protein [Bacteroidota bacterium]